MIVNNEVRTKHQTRERNELYLILNSIRRNSEDYDKKEDGKEKQRKGHRKTSIQRRREKTLRTQLREETMDIS